MFVNVSARDILQDYLWRHRLVLLFTSSLSDSLIAKQVSLLKSQTDELLDRDLKLIIVPRNSSPTIDGKSGFSSSVSFYKSFNVQDDGLLLYL